MSITERSTSLLLHEEDGRIQFNNQLLACIKKHNPRALEILKKFPDAGFARDWMGKTLLHYAAEKGNYPYNYTVLQHLIDSGADVEAKDSQGETPLMSILPPRCYTTSKAVVEILLKANANIHNCDNTGTSVLKRSLESRVYQIFLTKLNDEYSGDIEKIAKKLIDSNCSIYCVLALENAAVTRILLDNGCPIAPSNLSLYGLADVLVESVFHMNLENIKLLLDHGVDANAGSFRGYTSLSAYARCIVTHPNQNPEILQLLLNRGANPYNIMTTGNLPGRMVITNILRKGRVESIRILLESFDLEARDVLGCTALHYLAQNRSINIFELLKGKKFDVTARDNSGSTPLHHLKESNLSSMKFLLHWGANVSAKDNSGITPLISMWENFTDRYKHWDLTRLSFRNKIEKSNRIISYLLYRGADIEVNCGQYGDEGYSIFSDINDQYQCQLYWMQSVLAQLAINEARGIAIGRFIMNKIVVNNTLKKYYDMCKQQIEKMKQVEIDKSISLYTILIASDQKLQSYVRNERLLLNLRRLKYQNKYLPYYCYVLRGRVVKATKRVKRRKQFDVILCEVIGLSIDHDVIDKITQYLNDFDLRKVYCT